MIDKLSKDKKYFVSLFETSVKNICKPIKGLCRKKKFYTRRTNMSPMEHHIFKILICVKFNRM